MTKANDIFIGAENIVSPLGFSAEENFVACFNNQTGIAAHEGLGLSGETIYASRIKALPQAQGKSRIAKMLWLSVTDALRGTSLNIKGNTRVALLLSTTKGNIEALEQGDVESARLGKLLQELAGLIELSGIAQVVSNACISGSAALILAHDLIASNRADHVIVTGADVVSRFTVTGFQSLHAISDEPCRPFCKTRKGVSLGEAAGTIIVSRDREIFKETAYHFFGGATSNDANHISGPSRTGEGLLRAINRTLAAASVSKEEIDFISAHGTATLYNDDMESYAFNRAGLSDVPLNSFKGYFGHTLGAAGLVETAMCLQSLRNNTLIKNAGMVEPGTAEKVNVLREHVKMPLKMILKTASGFGGCNAALLINTMERG